MKRNSRLWLVFALSVLLAGILVTLGERVSKLQVENVELQNQLYECQERYGELKNAADAVLRKCVDADACVNSCICIHPEESMKIEDILWGKP